MSGLWHIEDENNKLTEDAKEFISENYELCYLYACHSVLKNTEIDTIITGLSYGLDDIETNNMKRNAINLSMHSQDIYYDALHIKKAVSENKNIKNIVMTIGYYSMFYDLSKSSGNSKCANIYRPLFDDSHHCDDSSFDHSLINQSLIKYREEILYYFGDKPEYYGKAIEREITNSEVYGKGGWYRLGIEERSRLARELSEKHNKHFEHLKTYEENVFILSDLFRFLNAKDINICLVILPYSKEYNTYIREEYLACILEYLNMVPEPIHFINMNELGFDSVKYFMDSDHLNYRGAIKASEYLDEFLDGINY